MDKSPESILIGGIQKFSIEDGPGIRTTIFIKGCPLNCKWCHNPELIDSSQQIIKSPNNCIKCMYCVSICPQGALKMTPEKGVVIDRDKCNLCLKCTDTCYSHALRTVAKLMNIKEVLDIAEQDKGFYDNTNGGITVSGGEILMHTEYVSKLIDEAAIRGMNVCIDTSGYGSRSALMRIALKENVTNILYDIKSVDDEIHKKYTGVSNLLIIDNLRTLAEDERTAEKLVIRMPLIKGVNDDFKSVRAAGKLFKEIGIKHVDLLPYHSLGVNKKKNLGSIQERFEQPTKERITEIEIYFKNEINLTVGVLGRV